MFFKLKINFPHKLPQHQQQEKSSQQHAADPRKKRFIPQNALGQREFKRGSRRGRKMEKIRLPDSRILRRTKKRIRAIKIRKRKRQTHNPRPQRASPQTQANHKSKGIR